jgi:Tol biopolymer transport system component
MPVVLLAACGARVDIATDGAAAVADGAPGDVDGPPAMPDAMLTAWTTPSPIPTGSTGGLAEDDPGPSATETELIFSGKLPDIAKNLYVMTRQTRMDPWGAATLVPGLNTTATEQTPRLTPDGLTLYFSSARNGGPGNDDIWVATRADVTAPWLNPTVVPNVNASADDRTLTPCQGGRYMMISFRGPGGTGDVYEGVLGGAAPTLVPQLSDPDAQETGTFVTEDCLKLWFASNRDGSNDIFYAHRAAVSDPWILDGKVAELSTPGANESDPWVSPDGHRMVFASDNGNGDNDLYVSTR